MQALVKFWHFFRRRKRVPLIVVGTHFDSFQLCETLNQDGFCKVAFVINEEPWQHKTIFAGAQCRYPSELEALVKNYSVKGVVFFSGTPSEYTPALKHDTLAALGCELIEVTEGCPVHEAVKRVRDTFKT